MIFYNKENWGKKILLSLANSIIQYGLHLNNLKLLLDTQLATHLT